MSEPRIPPSARALIALGEIMNRRPGPVPSIAELRARNADARLAPIFERADEPSPAIEQLHALVREIAAKRPPCRVHGDTMIPSSTPRWSNGETHYAGWFSSNLYTVSVHWRCPHPDHTPESP